MRDSKHYRYIQVPLPYGEELTYLEEEARECGIPFSTHLRNLLISRAKEHRGKSGIRWWSLGDMQALPPVSVTMSAQPEPKTLHIVDEATLQQNMDRFFDADDSPDD